MKTASSKIVLILFLVGCLRVTPAVEAEGAKAATTAAETKKKRKARKAKTRAKEKTQPKEAAKSKEQAQRKETAKSKDEAPKSVAEELAKEYDVESTAPVRAIADPIQPVNVAFFHVNDKVYFWVLKPVGNGYKYVLYPRSIRVGVREFIRNLGFPGRFFNTALQGKFKGTGVETLRFLTNTTIGVVGVWDPATKLFHMGFYNEDFDQTLGVWGAGMGIYLDIPLIGPSSLRGITGRLVDMALNPIASYSVVRLLNNINAISLGEDDYETLLQAALNPYVALRDAYADNRKKRVAE